LAHGREYGLMSTMVLAHARFMCGWWES